MNLIDFDNTYFDNISCRKKFIECNEALIANTSEKERITQLINTKRELLGNLESANKNSCYEYNVLKIELEDHKKEMQHCELNENYIISVKEIYREHLNRKLRNYQETLKNVSKVKD